jgi:DNA-binding CsgD family transcriptional regulator
MNPFLFDHDRSRPPSTTAIKAISSDGWSQPVDATLYLEGEMECGLMGHKFHRGFTAAEKTDLWDRWKRGESLKAIGRAFGKQSSSIYFLVAPHGGIRPAQRRRSRLASTRAEREVISRGVTAHQSTRSIARLLGRSPSTVSREMSRNGGCDRYQRCCLRDITGIDAAFAANLYSG